MILCPQGRFRAGCGRFRLRAQSPRIPCRSIATCLADTKDLPKQLLSYYFTFLFPRASNPCQEHCVPFCDVTKCDATADVLLTKPPVIVRRPSCFRGMCREKESRRQTRTADLVSLRVRFRVLSLSRKAAYVQRNGFAARRCVPPDYAQVGVSAHRRRVPFSCPGRSRLPAAFGLLSSRLTSLCDMVAPARKAPSSFAP